MFCTAPSASIWILQLLGFHPGILFLQIVKAANSAAEGWWTDQWPRHCASMLQEQLAQIYHNDDHILMKSAHVCAASWQLSLEFQPHQDGPAVSWIHGDKIVGAW